MRNEYNENKAIIILSIVISGFVFAVSPDNTAINKRDKSIVELTADQQSSNEKDVSLIRRIRQNIVKDSSISTYAKNIKLISDGGYVTLKGPVLNSEEKLKLEYIAKSIAGGSFVNNQIDIIKSSHEGE